MIGSVTERIAPNSNFVVNGTNGTIDIDYAARDAYRVQIACALSVLTGLFQVCLHSFSSVLLSGDEWLYHNRPTLTCSFQIILGVVRFGFVVNYLSEPLVRGYTTGSACHVCISQLKYLFGISPGRFTGPLSLIYVSNT